MPGMLQQNIMQGQDMSGMGGNDALYIGDLQWVRLFTVFPPCALDELCSVYSGPQMRISVS